MPADFCCVCGIGHDDFLDMAHVEYDLSIRKMAESIGFEVFASANTGSNVLH